MCCILTSADCVRGCSVDDARLEDSCGPAADTDAGYLTPVDADGDKGAFGGVDVLAVTENNSSMRSKSSLNSLNSRSPVVQTLLRPSTLLAGIFDQAKRRNLGRGAGCVQEPVDGCLTSGIWKPGLYGVVRKAGSGGGEKSILGVGASWPAATDTAGADNGDVDDDETFILPCICRHFQASDNRSTHSLAFMPL